MNNPFILLGVFIFLGFIYLDNALKQWKNEQNEKMDDLRGLVDDLKNSFDKKFGEDDDAEI